jgi:hypothetical protein
LGWYRSVKWYPAPRSAYVTGSRRTTDNRPRGSAPPAPRSYCPGRPPPARSPASSCRTPGRRSPPGPGPGRGRPHRPQTADPPSRCTPAWPGPAPPPTPRRQPHAPRSAPPCRARCNQTRTDSENRPPPEIGDHLDHPGSQSRRGHQPYPLRSLLGWATFTGRPVRSTGPPNTTVTFCPDPRSRPRPPPSSKPATGTVNPALPSSDMVAVTVSSTVIDSTGNWISDPLTGPSAGRHATTRSHPPAPAHPPARYPVQTSDPQHARGHSAANPGNTRRCTDVIPAPSHITGPGTGSRQARRVTAADRDWRIYRDHSERGGEAAVAVTGRSSVVPARSASCRI